MAKFEYRITAFPPLDEKEMEDRYNKLGAEGWELITIDENSGFKKSVFKREINSLFVAGIE
jgi:hypothetical protein